jgi:hypothetical protein
MASPENIDSFHEQQIGDEIKRISGELKGLTPNYTARLEEYIFLNVFIPLFAGDEKLLYDVTFQTWINVAGSPYKEVAIVDTKGKVLFIVPPILDRTAIKSSTDQQTPISSIVESAQQFARIHPNQGKAFIANELNKRAMLMKLPANMLNFLETWNSIFKRYGRPEIMPLDQTTVKPVSKTSENDFEEL